MSPSRLRWLIAYCALVVGLLTDGAVCADDHAPNRVLRLDGVGDYVQLPADLFTDFEQATVEAWVRWGDFPYFTQWFAFGRGSDFQGMGVNHQLWFATPQFFIYDRQRQGHVIGVPSDLPPDLWVHMAAVSGPGGMRFYINGALVGADDYAGSFADFGGGDENFLGRAPWEENFDFKGALDEIRVWRIARTGDQIRATMHRRLQGGEEGLAALWNFDGDCAGGVADLGAAGHSGRLLGDAHCAEEAVPASAPAPALLEGRITDAAGRPLAFAGVRLLRDGQLRAIALSDADGHYRIRIFDAGPYEVKAELGELGAWRTVHMRTEPNQRVDLVLQPALDIHGQVRALDYQPLADVVVQAVRRDAGGQVVQSVQSDERGVYRFMNLPPGSYHLRAHRRDHFMYSGDVAAEALADTLIVTADHRPQRMDLRLLPDEAGTWRTYAAFAGLAVDEIRAIARSEDGLLWLASAGAGLWRFDGEAFFQYTTEHGLPDNQVSALSPAAGGGLWVGTAHGVALLRDGAFAVYGRGQGLVDDEVNALHADTDGGLWVGTAHGVALLRDGAFVDLPFGQAMGDKNVNAILVDRRGALWMGSDDQGLWRYADGQLQNFSMREGVSNFRVWALYEASDGVLWIGTDNSVTRYDGTAFRHYFTYADPVAHHSIRAIAEDGDGALYFGTFGGGVLRLQGEHFTNLTLRDGLATATVFAAYADGEGALWFGGDGGGLSRYDTGSLVHFDRAYGLIGGEVLSLATARHVWLGTEHGPMRMDGRHFVRLGTAEGIDSPIKSMIAFDDTLYFGSADQQGAWRSVGGRLTLVSRQGAMSTAGATIEAVYRDDQSRLWLGLQVGVSGYDAENRQILMSEGHGLANVYTVAVGQARDGAVWLASEQDGLTRWDGTLANTYTVDDGLPSNLVRAIHRAADGRLWFGSFGGLSRWDGAGFINYSTRDGLAHNRIEAIAEDAEGRLWLATYGGGVALYDGVAWSALDTRDGLASDQVNAVAVDAEGQVWLGTSKGLARYRPMAQPPGVRILAAHTDGTYQAPQSVTLTADTRLTVDYRAIDYQTLPAKRQYRHRVVGVSDGWSAPTRDARFEWTPDAPGEYVFEVQAIDRDLNYSEPARLAVRVVPIWYSNPWIVGPAGGGVLLLLAVAVVASARSYRSRREAQALREQVLAQERAAREQLEASNAELSTAYEQTQAARQQAEAAAAEARAAAVEARQANQAKSAFLAHMSHELRTPLNAILGFSQLLHRGNPLPEQRESLGIIRRSGEHLLALINDVLEMSRIEAGRTILEVQAFDLHELLDSIADMFRLRAEGKRLRLTCEYTDSLPRYVRTDEGKLRQILINLLGNAVKFTEEGGIGVRAEMGGDQLRVAVADTGPGIGAEEQESLFDTFVQTRSGRQAQGGTGLGLAISRQFAELMGGDISLRSEVGQGSTFVLEVPVSPADVADIAAPQDARRVAGLSPGQPEWRILVVDDSADNRKLLDQMLIPLGFAVREAADGREAIAAWRDWQPQLILMDMRMPVMDGYEATRRIKAEAGAQAPVIIALTASAFEEDRKKVLDAGCDDFLRKPFREGELLAAMQEFLAVEYVYVDEVDERTGQDAVNAEELRGLPAAWRQALVEAARVADEVRLLALIAEIESDHAVLARGLRQLLDDFAFDEIILLAGE